MSMRKVLFSDMTLNEKKNLVTVWKNVEIRGYSRHAKQKMNELSITESMINDTWKVNHIIEYKVEDGRTKIMVRGVNAHECDAQYMVNRTERTFIGKNLCNVCLVVDVMSGQVVTVYASPVNARNRYTCRDSYSQMDDNLRKNLETIVKRVAK